MIGGRPPDLPRADRRQWLGRGALVLAASLLARTPGHAASAKLSRADAGYQLVPRGDQRCGLCASFVPGGDPNGSGACKLVEGPIPPMGWCQLFAKR